MSDDAEMGTFRRRVLLVVSAVLAVLAVLTLLMVESAGPQAMPGLEVANAAGTLPVGAPLPSGEECAAVADASGSDREAIPQNTGANLSVPAPHPLPPWPDYWKPVVNRVFVPRIDGRYVGTTDQIIVWGACKWGINTDIVRAVAMTESSWRQAFTGDYVDNPALCVGGYKVPCPTSFGLLQIKHIYRPGSWPASQEHTAFNVDYGLGVIRGCYEGWVAYLGDGYGPGDLWGCLGWNFSGEWRDGPAQTYIGRVEHSLRDEYWKKF